MRLSSARLYLLLGSAFVITPAFAQNVTAPAPAQDGAPVVPQDATPSAAQAGQDVPATGD